MKGSVFHACVVATVDEEGDPALEIIWADRRILISVNLSRVGVDPGAPHGWCYSSKADDIVGTQGDDLASLAAPLYKLARWQTEHDEHLGAEDRAAKLAGIDALRAKALGT